MMRVIRRASPALVAVALTLTMLIAPTAWASSSPGPGPHGWFMQFLDHVSAWLAPGETGPAADHHGLEAFGEKSSTEVEAWEPVPLDGVDPATTDSSSEDGDTGASIDPDG